MIASNELKVYGIGLLRLIADSWICNFNIQGRSNVSLLQAAS